MGAYSKLIAAAVGVALLMLNRHAGLDLGQHEAAIVDIVISVLTAVGVYAAKNKEPA
jgi:hypothetical protein